MSLSTTLKLRISHTAHVSSDTLASRAYLYRPLEDSYLIPHLSISSSLSSHIIPCTLLTTGITVSMFFITYLPQAAVFTFVNGPLGPLNAIALVLSESRRSPRCLKSEGQDALVSKGRELKPDSDRQGVNKLGKILMKSMNKDAKWARDITRGSSSSKGIKPKQIEEEIERRRGGYIAFGTVVITLNLIPFASIFFTVNSTVGAALCVTEIEKGVEHPDERVHVTGRAEEKQEHDL